MSKWANQIQEFHQLISAAGVYDLHTASKHGRWVMSSQGWGMPPIDWIIKTSPFQHGATVKDYRLQPRIIQLLVEQNFCSRDAYWAGRSALIDAMRPNRTSLTFTDKWVPRSAYQTGGVYPTGADQKLISALAEFEGQLYGASGSDGGTTGGVLFLWDGGGSWQEVDSQAFVGAQTETEINALISATIEVPVWGDVPTTLIAAGYATNDDGEEGILYDRTQNGPWLGQTFTPSATIELDSIMVKVYCTTNAARWFNLDVYATAGGKPTGSALASGFYPPTSGVSTASPGAWVTIPYTGVGRITLSSGTVYAIVMSSSNSAGTLNWRQDQTAPSYAGGTAVNAPYSMPGNPVWSVEAGVDFMFSVSGIAHVYTITGSETRSVLLAGCGTDAIVVPWDGEWLDEYGAVSTESRILSLVDWNGSIYCGTNPNGNLLEYAVNPATGVGSLTQVAAHLHPSDNIYCLAVYDDGAGEDIYGGTDGGLLYRSAGAAWTQVCASPAAQTAIWALRVYKDFLYGSTGPDGYLVRYDVGGGHWDIVTTVPAGNDIRTLFEYKGRLYGAGDDGHLYQWNNVDAWTSICIEYVGDGGAESVYSSIVYQNRPLAGTSAGAYLIEWIHEQTLMQPSCLTLRRHLSNGQNRDLCVFPIEGPVFDASEGGWSEWSFKEMLRFIAYDPTLYDPTVIGVPYLLGTGFISEAESITYTGTWHTHPTLILTGPLEHPSIVNETIDQQISMDYNIPDSDVVTIDLSALTCQDQDGVNLIGTLSADSQLSTFVLEPSPAVTGGINRVLLSAGGAGANSDFIIEYVRRYIGV